MATIDPVLEQSVLLTATMDGMLAKYDRDGVDPSVRWAAREAHRVLQPMTVAITEARTAQIAATPPPAP